MAARTRRASERRRKSRRWSVQLSLIGVCALACLGCEQEPQYQGTSASTWASALRSDNPGMQQQAADALVAIGSPAVPQLVEVIQDRSASVTARCVAIETAYRLGPKAADAVPALSAALTDSDRRIRIRAVRAVGQMGPAGKKAAGGLIAAARRAADDIDEEMMTELETTAAKLGVHIR